MDLHTEIEKLTKNFSFDWYQKKLEEFKNTQKGYQPTTNTRLKKVAGFNTGIDEKTGHPYSEIAWEETEETTIEEYCWYNEDQPEDRRIIRIGKKIYMDDASMLMNEFFISLDEFLQEADVDLSVNIINTTESLIHENIIRLSSNNSNKEYVKVCEYIRHRGSFSMRKRYEHIQQLFIFKNKGFPRLEFDLNKQQLSALVFLLFEAGFITKKERGIVGKYDFFEKYFYWTDSSNDMKYPLSDLRRIVNKFSSGEKSNPIDEVMEKLNKAFDTYLD